jgi:predicted ArsR family transcriptional regulator
MKKKRKKTESISPLLNRLAVVYALKLRQRMMAELLMRDISPTQFHEEFGGGSVPRVDRHLQALAGRGWAMLVEEKSGGRRRGGTEHFYRATKPVAFDTPTWSQLPYSIRATISQVVFKELSKRVQRALEAGTLDARPDRHLSWTPLLLDQCGWARVIAAVDALFEALPEEQAAARQRIAESGENPILMTVSLAAFESIGSQKGPESGCHLDLVEVTASPVEPFRRVSKLLEDEICLLIVDELHLRAMSVPQFHNEFGDELGVSRDCIRGRFKRLIELNWLMKTGVRKVEGRRGAPEHVYRATRPPVFGSESWAQLPTSIRATHSWRAFDNLSKQVRMAMEAGTFDARTDRHQTWSPLRVDRQGWERVIAKVDAVFHSLFKEQKAAKVRMAKSGEDPIPMIVALAAFESPKNTEKQP